MKQLAVFSHNYSLLFLYLIIIYLWLKNDYDDTFFTWLLFEALKQHSYAACDAALAASNINNITSNLRIFLVLNEK